jgi:hypothetical protein
MAAGDVLHEFALFLFDKIDRGEPWSDAHALNAMLQSSLSLPVFSLSEYIYIYIYIIIKNIYTVCILRTPNTIHHTGLFL